MRTFAQTDQTVKYRRLSSCGLSQQQLPLILHADPSRVSILRYVTEDGAISLATSSKWERIIDDESHTRRFSGNEAGDCSNLPDTPTEPNQADRGTPPRFTALSCSRTLTEPRKKIKEEGEGASGFSFRLSCASFIQWLYCFFAFNEVDTMSRLMIFCDSFWVNEGLASLDSLSLPVCSFR